MILSLKSGLQTCKCRSRKLCVDVDLSHDAVYSVLGLLLHRWITWNVGALNMHILVTKCRSNHLFFYCYSTLPRCHRNYVCGTFILSVYEIEFSRMKFYLCCFSHYDAERESEKEIFPE